VGLLVPVANRRDTHLVEAVGRKVRRESRSASAGATPAAKLVLSTQWQSKQLVSQLRKSQFVLGKGILSVIVFTTG
jgi:hypothetical protein